MKEPTTITIERLTRNKLASFGRKDDSFEDVITMLIKKVEAN